MPPQKKPNKPESIDHTDVTTAALKTVKTACDYHRLGSRTEPAIFQAGWDNLDPAEQKRICQIVDNNIQPDPQTIASELSACGELIQLKAVKADYGEALVKQAWRFLPESEKQRLKAICKAPPPEPQTIPEAYPENIEKTNAFIKKHLAETEPIKSVGSAHQNTPSDTPAAQSSRTLFKISDDLLELNELLDECDDAQQEALISQCLSS